MKLTFEIVTWPEIQEYMEKDGFRENACLANDEHFVNVFGSSAYFVNSKWKDDIDSMKQLPIKEVKQVHAGQYRPYGDTFDVWEIYLEEGESFDREDVLVFCFTELSRRKVQSKQEWNANHGNADAYFSGYYELEKTSYGYKFTVCSPYTD